MTWKIQNVIFCHVTGYTRRNKIDLGFFGEHVGADGGPQKSGDSLKPLRKVSQRKRVYTKGPERRVYIIEASDPEKKNPWWWCIICFASLKIHRSSCKDLENPNLGGCSVHQNLHGHNGKYDVYFTSSSTDWQAGVLPGGVSSELPHQDHANASCSSFGWHYHGWWRRPQCTWISSNRHRTHDVCNAWNQHWPLPWRRWQHIPS